MKVNLTKKEYAYLKKNLLKNNKKTISKLGFHKENNESISVEMDDELARYIRELAGDRMASLYFNKDYGLIGENRMLSNVIDKLYKIKVKVNLTMEEYHYLVNILLKGKNGIISKLEVSKAEGSTIDINLSGVMADDIRELAIDEIGCHFDKKDRPDKEALILESLLDKFYVG